MIVTLICLIISVAVRITFGYLSGRYSVLAPSLPWLTGVCIVFGVLLGILIVVRIVKEIRK